jgi:hypothetical protein
LKAHRFGKLTADNKVYTGEWHLGKKHGAGTMTYQNGDKYSGAWYNDFRHGFGKLELSRGDTYEGEWSNN